MLRHGVEELRPIKSELATFQPGVCVATIRIFRRTAQGKTNE